MCFLVPLWGEPEILLHLIAGREAKITNTSASHKIIFATNSLSWQAKRRFRLCNEVPYIAKCVIF